MKNTDEMTDDYFNLVIDTLQRFDRKSMSDFVDQLIETHDKGGTIYIFGNGGSGACASHFCGDFLKGVSYDLGKKFKTICLNDNIPAFMAVANDISYEHIFLEQLKVYMEPNDLVIGISGSGNSMNVVNAMNYAKENGVKTAAFCGYDGGKIKNIADVALHADIMDMEVSEDIHMVFTHCAKAVIIEKFGGKRGC